MGGHNGGSEWLFTDTYECCHKFLRLPEVLFSRLITRTLSVLLCLFSQPVAASLSLSWRRAPACYDVTIDDEGHWLDQSLSPPRVGRRQSPPPRGYVTSNNPAGKHCLAPHKTSDAGRKRVSEMKGKARAWFRDRVNSHASGPNMACSVFPSKDCIIFFMWRCLHHCALSDPASGFRGGKIGARPQPRVPPKLITPQI